MRRMVTIGAVGLVLVGGLVVGCGESTSGSSGGGGGGGDGGGDASSKTTPKVSGAMKDSIFISGDAEARQNMRITKVWCRWNGDQVEIGATLHNGMATHVTVHVQPNYRLLKSGLHGDGAGSTKDAGVDAGETRVWTAKIGNPDNVDGSPAITSCEPELMGVDLG